MAAEAKLSHTAAMILQAIYAGFVYGFSIMEMTGLPSGTVYPAMRRLERDELIRSQWERQSIADAEQRPPRKYYKLTAAGKPRSRPPASAIPCSSGSSRPRRPNPYEAAHPTWSSPCLDARASSHRLAPRAIAPARRMAARMVSSELWHVRRSCIRIDDTSRGKPSAKSPRFCLGAFPDALCLRTSAWKRTRRPVHIHGSAAHTPSLAFRRACHLFRHRPPAPRRAAENEAVALPDQPQRAPHQRMPLTDADQPSISTALYQNWKSNAPAVFRGACLLPRRARSPQMPAPVTTRWNVAHSTRNLFSLLGLPIHFTIKRDTDSDLPAVILSHDTWMRYFAGDPHVAGRIIRIGQLKSQIAGVAPAGALAASRNTRCWLLESDPIPQSRPEPTATSSPISPRGQAAMSGPRHRDQRAQSRTASAIDLYGISFDGSGRRPVGHLQFALFLALSRFPPLFPSRSAIPMSALIAPRGSSSVSAAAVSRLRNSPSSQPSSSTASLDLAYCSPSATRRSPSVIQLLSCFHHLSLWIPLGHCRPAQTLPRLPAPRHQSSHRGPGLAHLPRLERHRDDLHGRPRASPRPILAHQLVQRPALALPR